jgi:hypothetical protein
MTRTAAEIIGGLILIVAGFFYIEHLGAAKCLRQEASTVSTQEQRNAKVEAAGTIAGIVTENTYANALKSPLSALPGLEGLPADLHGVPNDGGVRGAAHRCPVPPAGGHSAPSDYRPTIRNEAQASLVLKSWGEFERSDVQDAHDADAEVIYLQTLLQTQYAVCTGQLTRARP